MISKGTWAGFFTFIGGVGLGCHGVSQIIEMSKDAGTLEDDGLGFANGLFFTLILVLFGITARCVQVIVDHGPRGPR